MANRAMLAKVERAKSQARDLAQAEYSKPFYASNFSLTTASREARHAETAALVAAFQGKITKCKAGSHPTERVRSTVCLGDATEGRAALVYGTPRRAGIRYATNTTSRLIAR